MRVLQRLARSRSSCSASQKSLPPRSVWRRLNTALAATVFLLLGQVCFSEWSLMAFFPGFSSSFALFALHPSGSATSHERGVLFCTTFAHPISDELFNNLVAQFVGNGAHQRHYPPLERDHASATRQFDAQMSAYGQAAGGARKRDVAAWLYLLSVLAASRIEPACRQGTRRT